MGLKAMAAVGDRSRASQNELLLLLKIADLADDDGRNCWMETPAMAKWLRSSTRGVQKVLRRLQGQGEIRIDLNTTGREITIGHRHFRPKWFIHVRCICEWETYRKESEQRSHFAVTMPRGRPSRKSEQCSHSYESKMRTPVRRNANARSPKCEQTGTAYKEVPSSDPLGTQEQGRAAARTPRSPSPNPIDNVKVITKLVHEILDHFPHPEDLTGLVKDSCASLDIAYNSESVARAIEAANFQRVRAGKQPSDSHSSGAVAAAAS